MPALDLVANPPSPSQAQALIAQIAEMLGVDDPKHADHATIDKALDMLFEIVTGGDQSGKVNANAIKRGREYLSGSLKKTASIDPKAVERGRLAFKR